MMFKTFVAIGPSRAARGSWLLNAYTSNTAKQMYKCVLLSLGPKLTTCAVKTSELPRRQLLRRGKDLSLVVLDDCTKKSAIHGQLEMHRFCPCGACSARQITTQFASQKFFAPAAARDVESNAFQNGASRGAPFPAQHAENNFRMFSVGAPQSGVPHAAAGIRVGREVQDLVGPSAWVRRTPVEEFAAALV